MGLGQDFACILLECKFTVSYVSTLHYYLSMSSMLSQFGMEKEEGCSLLSIDIVANYFEACEMELKDR
jgi:hypothetical protein